MLQTHLKSELSVNPHLYRLTLIRLIGVHRLIRNFQIGHGNVSQFMTLIHKLWADYLHDAKFISDSSLNDIKYVLNPIFTPEQITQLDYNTKMSRAIDSTMYMPGIVGLNNIKANDYCNVILQVS